MSSRVRSIRVRYSYGYVNGRVSVAKIFTSGPATAYFHGGRERSASCRVHVERDPRFVCSVHRAAKDLLH